MKGSLTVIKVIKKTGNDFIFYSGMESLIKHIADTAFWVAVFRADESDRPDAVFNDPFARRLAGERGEEIAHIIEFSRKNRWSFVARTFLFDEFIKQHVADGYDMIINLAAGLDARPYRMPLPATLNWVEVDFPEMIAYKQSMLADEEPICKLRSIKMDLANRKQRVELFNELGKEASKALIICEGLMIYLDAEEAAALATDLGNQESFKRWALDLASPGLLIMAQKEMGDHLKDSNAEFKFAPEEGEAFYHRYGWQHLQSRSKLKTAAALNRLTGELMKFADIPEPEGPKGAFPWSGVCLFENRNK